MVQLGIPQCSARPSLASAAEPDRVQMLLVGKTPGQYCGGVGILTLIWAFGRTMPVQCAIRKIGRAQALCQCNGCLYKKHSQFERECSRSHWLSRERKNMPSLFTDLRQLVRFVTEEPNTEQQNRTSTICIQSERRC